MVERGEGGVRRGERERLTSHSQREDCIGSAKCINSRTQIHGAIITQLWVHNGI